MLIKRTDFGRFFETIFKTIKFTSRILSQNSNLQQVSSCFIDETREFQTV